MVKLKSINIKNFKSFKDTALTFPESGLLSLEGKNLDTGGSSGAGKSNLNNAIAYALGYASAPASTMQSWHNDEPMQVVLTLSTDQGDIVISKGHKNSLKVGDRTITGAKAIEETLQQIIGLDSDTLKTLVYRPQKTAGLFLSMDDADKKDFLGRVLHLDRYEMALAKAIGASSLVETELQIVQRTHDTLAATLNPVEKPLLQELVLDELRDEKAKFEAEALKATADAAKMKEHLKVIDDRYQAAVKTITDKFAPKVQLIEDQIKTYWDGWSFTPDLTEIRTKEQFIAAVKTRYESAQALYKTELEAYKAATSKRMSERSFLLNTIGSKTSEAKKLSEILHVISDLQNGVCSTCKRDGFTGTETILEYQEKAKKCEENLRVIAQAEEDLKRFEEQPEPVEPSNERVLKLRDILTSEQEKLNNLKGNLTEQERAARAEYSRGVEKLEESLKSLKHLQAQELSELQVKYTNSVAKTKESVYGFESKAKDAAFRATQEETKLKDIFKEYDFAKKVYDAYVTAQKKVDDAKVELDSLGKKKQNVKATVDALKGFLGSIFEEILTEVADETNDILRTIPNVSHCSIEFRTEQVTQKGTAKKRITPVIMVDGHEGTLKTSCSGGMESAIELAVDISVANVISRRTGASPQWVVLDEAFDGFDAVTKESCLEMLQKHSNDKLVVVVTHSNDFKEFFANSIEVEYKNGESRIVT